ncbi:putative chromatin remodeling & transcriptional activation HMG family [Helianthus annuus]|nr:putative chromatin remodeling & transcriptional activation HMG family [Helianthus annuus]
MVEYVSTSGDLILLMVNPFVRLFYSIFLYFLRLTRLIVLMFVNLWILKMKLISKLIDMRLKTHEMNPSLDSTCQRQFLCKHPKNLLLKLLKKSVKAKELSAKKSKKEKDPSEPKRPPTTFFLFMEDFRKTYKEANPDNKKVSLVAKEGGEKWKSMTEEKSYVERAIELKEKYQKAF